MEQATEENKQRMIYPFAEILVRWNVTFFGTLFRKTQHRLRAALVPFA